VKRWGNHRPRHFNYKNGRRSRERIGRHAVRWLRFLGRLRFPHNAPPAYRSLLESFLDHLRIEKGLSEASIQTRHWHLEDFLRWFFRDHNSFCQIRISDVDEAITRKGRDDGYARLSIPFLCFQPPLFPPICGKQRLVHTRARRIGRVATDLRARKSPRGSILGGCTASCRFDRGIPP
jgi:hypothetical protein